MIGSLFAGCEEAPGAPVIRNGQKVKVVRGMASLGAAISRQVAEAAEDESAEDQQDWDKVVPEGVEAVVPYRGHVQEILYQLVGGLRSGLSYGGATTIAELQEKAEFIEISPAGMKESAPHDVSRLWGERRQDAGAPSWLAAAGLPGEEVDQGRFDGVAQVVLVGAAGRGAAIFAHQRERLVL